MYVIKKLGVLSAGYTSGLITLVIGAIPWLIVGIVYMLFIRPRYSYYGYGYARLDLEEVLGWAVVPIILWLAGFLSGLLISWLFNITSHFTGGLKVDLALDDQKQQPNK